MYQPSAVFAHRESPCWGERKCGLDFGIYLPKSSSHTEGSVHSYCTRWQDRPNIDSWQDRLKIDRLPTKSRVKIQTNAGLRTRDS